MKTTLQHCRGILLIALFTFNLAIPALSLAAIDESDDPLPDPDAPQYKKVKDGVPSLDDSTNPLDFYDPIGPDGTPPNWDPTDPNLDDNGWRKIDGQAPLDDPSTDEIEYEFNGKDEFDD